MDNSDPTNVSNPLVPTKRKRGRPTKEESLKIAEERRIAKRNALGRGRPKELGTKVQELKERLLLSKESSLIVGKVISKALNDEDKDQMVALKLCLDRILPVSAFEKAKNEGRKIEINISGMSDVSVIGSEDVEDANVIEEHDDEA